MRKQKRHSSVRVFDLSNINDEYGSLNLNAQHDYSAVFCVISVIIYFPQLLLVPLGRNFPEQNGLVVITQHDSTETPIAEIKSPPIQISRN